MKKRNLPIIVLSAKSEDSDKILGLSMGADDYVTKPYNPQELAARVKSQLRRYTRLGDIHASEQTEELTNGRLTFRTDGKNSVCGRGSGKTNGNRDENYGAFHA